MEENIKQESNIMDWKDCPYKCGLTHEIYNYITGEFEPCPYHGALANKVELLDEVNTQNVWKLLNIPWNMQYIDHMYNASDFFAEWYNITSMETPKRKKFELYMQKIVEGIKAKKLYAENIIFFSPASIDMLPFVYGCLIGGMLQGFKVLPVINLRELYLRQDIRTTYNKGEMEVENVSLTDFESIKKQLKAEAFEKNPYTYEDYLKADLIFLQLDTTIPMNSVLLLTELLKIRSMSGLVTYLIGDSLAYANKELRARLKYIVIDDRDYKNEKVTLVPRLTVCDFGGIEEKSSVNTQNILAEIFKTQ